jgi:phage shock protein C
MNRRLYRSYDDRVLAGVAGGMAETYDFDPALVRIAWVILALLTGIFPLLIVYIVMAFVVPLAPDDQPAGRWAAGSWPTRSWPEGAAGTEGAEGAPVNDATQFTQEASTTMTEPTTQPFMSEREMRRQRRMERRQGGDMTGALVFGLILIVLGVFFLAQQYIPAINWGQLWPIGLIAIGLILLVGAFRRSGR